MCPNNVVIFVIFQLLCLFRRQPGTDKWLSLLKNMLQNNARQQRSSKSKLLPPKSKSDFRRRYSADSITGDTSNTLLYCVFRGSSDKQDIEFYFYLKKWPCSITQIRFFIALSLFCSILISYHLSNVAFLSLFSSDPEARLNNLPALRRSKTDDSLGDSYQLYDSGQKFNLFTEATCRIHLLPDLHHMKPWEKLIYHLRSTRSWESHQIVLDQHNIASNDVSFHDCLYVLFIDNYTSYLLNTVFNLVKCHTRLLRNRFAMFVISICFSSALWGV